MYVCACVSRCSMSLESVAWHGAGAGGATHVDLAILEALLQVVVDGLVGDLAN
jgi:hypothetical protein